IRKMLQSKRRSREHPRQQRAVGRPKLAGIVQVVSTLSGMKPRTVRESRGGPIRRLIAWLWWNEGLSPLRMIASALGLRSLGHISGEIRRCERELACDPALVGLA